jgi:uncharacterized protein YkwD
LFLGLALAAFGVAQPAQPAVAATNCGVSDSFDSEEQAFLNLINQYRAQNGRAPLTVSSSLNNAAAWLAKDMTTKRYFSHTDSLGRDMATRLGQCDARPYNGENIAAGTYRSSAQDAFNAWRNSSGHNANMLRSSFVQIGIARHYDASSPYRWYWVTDFSTSSDGGSTGGSTASSGGSTSSGATSNTPATAATPKPAPTSAPSTTAAQITSPGNGATLSYSTTFSWTAVSGAQGYAMYIGTSKGANNLLSVSVGKATALRVIGFPSNGATVYVRLLTLLPSGWVSQDYTYKLP